MNPLINILVRNKYRPELFRRCLRSIALSGYGNIRLIIACDSVEAVKDVTVLFQNTNIEPLVLFVTPDRSHSHYWNLYCNELKARVDDGWFFFLDNDDYLESEGVLNIVEAIRNTTPDIGIICQFKRNGIAKPVPALMAKGIIQKGRIGGGCIVLHHTQKAIADWDGEQAADFRYIEAVSKKIKLKFVQVVLQVAGNNGLHGK